MADLRTSTESLNKPSAQLHLAQSNPRTSLFVWLWSTASSLRSFAESKMVGSFCEQIAHFPSWLSNMDWNVSRVIPYLRRRSLSSWRFLLVSLQFRRYSLSYFLLLTRLFISRDHPRIFSRFLSYPQSAQNFGTPPIGFTSTDFSQIWHCILSGLGFAFRCTSLALARQSSQYVNSDVFGLMQLGHSPAALYRSYRCDFVSM